MGRAVTIKNTTDSWGAIAKSFHWVITLDNLLEFKPDFNPDASLTAWSPLNPEALRSLSRTFFDDPRKSGLDVPDNG